MGKPNLARKEEGANEEVQHQGAQDDFAHLMRDIQERTTFGVVGRHWLGDNEWCGYRVDTGMRGAW